MFYEFRVGYDEITNFDAPGYNQKEASTFLTQSQENLVYDIHRNGLDYSEEERKSLSMLKTYTALTSAAGNYPNGYLYTLPAGLMFVTNERVDITFNTTSTYYNYNATTHQKLDVRVKPVSDDYYNANVRNPNRQPSHEVVWRLDHGNTAGSEKRHELICDSTFSIAATDYYLYYLRKPRPIIIEWASYAAGDGSIDGTAWTVGQAADQDCELDQIVHRRIIDSAVKLAYKALKDSQGYQLSAVDEQEKGN